jgi:hypothetical protein
LLGINMISAPNGNIFDWSMVAEPFSVWRITVYDCCVVLKTIARQCEWPICERNSGMCQQGCCTHLNVPVVVSRYAITLRVSGYRRVMVTSDSNLCGGKTDLGSSVRPYVLDLVCWAKPLKLPHDLQVGSTCLLSETTSPTEAGSSVHERKSTSLSLKATFVFISSNDMVQCDLVTKLLG